MNLFAQELPVVYLRPGEMHFAERPALVVTVLGSCLSVTMFSRRKGLGGICHGLLPQCGGKHVCDGNCLQGFKYVDCSIEKMVKLFDEHGVKRGEIEVKCFGGADMFTRQGKVSGVVSVGRQNVQTAKKILAHEGLHIMKMDVGGPQGRKIIFNTYTGEVFLKRLTQMNVLDIKK
jgi:chemotaxis protein CheD